MTVIPAKVVERIKDNLTKIQKVIDQAKSRDINEADTVVIVTDVLTNIFGYDKYTEVTREYAIKSTYCDLAVKIDEKLVFLIEVKAIGIALQEKHCQQALDYGANNGTEWIVLTNGLNWRVYQVKFEKPIRTELICEFNLAEIKTKNVSDMDKLYILCKEGIKKNAIDEFTQHKMVVNRYYIGALIQSDFTIELLKRELRKINPLIKFDDDEVLNVIKNDVLKRDVIDSPEAIEAFDKYNKILKKIEKKRIKDKEIGKVEKSIDAVSSQLSIQEGSAENNSEPIEV